MHDSIGGIHITANPPSARVSFSINDNDMGHLPICIDCPVTDAFLASITYKLAVSSNSG